MPPAAVTLTPQRIGVIGVGHVGLISAATAAEMGHDVVAMDLDAAKIELLEGGKLPFTSPAWTSSSRPRSKSGRLRFTTRPADAVNDAEVVLICADRPSTPAGDTSLTAVEAVGREIAQHAAAGVVIAEKSTVPPGTADRLRLTIAREQPGLTFSVVANPEFLREGQAVEDSLTPDRIVVGADDERGFQAMRALPLP